MGSQEGHKRKRFEALLNNHGGEWISPGKKPKKFPVIDLKS